VVKVKVPNEPLGPWEGVGGTGVKTEKKDEKKSRKNKKNKEKITS
jgi:hypothetical protein